MDISFENIQSLVRRGGQGVVADMEFLPFKGETFDLVYGFGILHHLNDIRKGVSEATRVLKNGGYIGFGGENNGLCPLTYLCLSFTEIGKSKRVYRIRKGNLKKIFRELGIREFRISRQGMTIYGMGRAVYEITSFMERILSKMKPFKRFQGIVILQVRKCDGI
jgi:ubiquinone/menaquinone biosynthesis C-methylase UbiE